jgi:transcription-repair coupling factor (superfamily II helicase)
MAEGEWIERDVCRIVDRQRLPAYRRIHDAGEFAVRGQIVDVFPP